MDTILERALQSLTATKFSLPEAPAYQAVANIWAHSGSKPKVVIHCTNTEDVQAGIKLAREGSLPISVRAGGHDWVGRALCDGVVLDMTPMRAVEVPPGNNTVRIGGGAAALMSIQSPTLWALLPLAAR